MKSREGGVQQSTILKSQALPAQNDAAYRVHAEAGVPNFSTMGALALLVRQHNLSGYTCMHVLQQQLGVDSPKQ